MKISTPYLTPADRAVVAAAIVTALGAELLVGATDFVNASHRPRVDGPSHFGVFFTSARRRVGVLLDRASDSYVVLVFTLRGDLLLERLDVPVCNLRETVAEAISAAR